MAKRGKKPRANPPTPKTEREQATPRGRGRPPLTDDERAARNMSRVQDWKLIKDLPCGPQDLRKQARSFAPAALAIVHSIMMGGSHAAALRLRAAEVVLSYAIAKPVPTEDDKGNEAKGPVDRLIDALTAKTPMDVPAIAASKEDCEVIEMGIAMDEDGE